MLNLTGKSNTTGNIRQSHSAYSSDWLFVCVNACVSMSCNGGGGGGGGGGYGSGCGGVCVCVNFAKSNSDGQIDFYVVKLGIPFFFTGH